MLTVMLIDDEPSVSTALTLLLQALGYKVIAYPGGPQALKALSEGVCPDHILCDLKMPDMDGLEVIKRISESHAGPKITLISAHATQKEVELAKQRGANGFLPKPFTPADLQKVLGPA